MLHYLIQLNFNTVLICVFTLIFVNVNRVFEKRTVRAFSLAAIFILMLVVVDSIDKWCSTFSYPTTLRLVETIIGYILRPSAILLIIDTVGRNYLSRRFHILILLPDFINAVIVSTALFSDIAFSYSSQNEFVRGPLGYITYITSAIYLIILVIITEKKFNGQHAIESHMILSIVIITIASVVMETIFNYEGIINITASISTVFYYIYLTTQQFKRDPLTSAYSRRCFYIDAERNFQSLTAVISIDLNNLKTINDTYGHSEGDKALCTIVHCINKILPKNCFLYRTGGDEFMILCFKQTRENVLRIPENIDEGLKTTPYVCAIGTAFAEDSFDFEKTCSIADAAMYENKRLLKNGDAIR